MDRLNYIVGELRRILAEVDSEKAGARGAAPSSSPPADGWIKGKPRAPAGPM